jgi:Mg-chelatase subunit ChlD
MAALVSALDNFTPSQLGENGSTEYTWSNSIRERIVQLSFQLTRTRDQNTIVSLAKITDDLLSDIKRLSYSNREEYVEYMSLLYRLIAHTRDIVDGKGEYTLSYMLLGVWDRHHPELAQFALRQFVIPSEPDAHPYGSWKDIKYLHKYDENSQLVSYGIDLMVHQLRLDAVNNNPSLAAKWVPREKSQFKELFTILATNYFQEYISTAKTDDKKRKAVLKAKMDFRKLISSLNKKLDTVQIKQCSNSWSTIDPTKQTSITMHKQKKAFLNLTKKGEQRSESDDRIACATNFTEYAAKATKGEVEIKGKRIGLNDFTQNALKLRQPNDAVEIEILNAQWRNNSVQTGALGKMIAMVDVSGSMSGDPMHAAIALGIRVAEKSLLGKRVLTFSANPTWVNLDGIYTFHEMVQAIARAEWGMNTNFAAALKMILDAIVSQKLKPEDVEDMVLTIFSDMQIDAADNKSLSLMNSIERSYADAGQRLWGKPFNVPHILFWNLQSTSGFPTLSTQKNASMMSGFSPALLNLFCDEGLEALQSCTPWSLFVKGLDNTRYKIMDEYIKSVI